jgi:DNA-directed RNA polymerase specialized sigma24 family protein
LALSGEEAAPDPAATRLVESLERLRPRLKQIMWSFRLREEQAEDVLQDLLLVALDHLHRSAIEDLDAWILVTLRYQCLMHLRKEEARRRRETVWCELFAGRRPGPGMQLREALQAGIAQLPGKQRQILRLRLAGHSNVEISELTGTSIHVVRKLCLLAVRRLRVLLKVQRQCSRRTKG